jgi:hypothetical protein
LIGKRSGGEINKKKHFYPLELFNSLVKDVDGSVRTKMQGRGRGGPGDGIIKKGI